MKIMNPPGDPSDCPNELPDTREAARIRGLFQRSTPRGDPTDLERLLMIAATRGAKGTLRWKPLAVAALLLFSGAGLGWLLAQQEMKQEIARMQGGMAVQLRQLRLDVVNELSQALQQCGQDLLRAQEDGMKQVAILLRNDYRQQLARLQTEVRELAIDAEHPAVVFLPSDRSVRQRQK